MAKWDLVRGRVPAVVGFDDLPDERGEPPTLRADRAKEVLVFGGRYEAEAVDAGRGADPGKQVHDSEVYGNSGCCSATSRVPAGVDLVVLLPDVLCEEHANMRRVALELAVREGSFLEWPEPPHPVVRLPENAQPEQADRDDQHGSAHERDEELGVDLGRHAADRADERIVAPTQRPLLGGRSSLLRCLSVRQGLRGSASRTLRPCW